MHKTSHSGWRTWQVAAYLLDSSPRACGFCRVPPTAIVRTEHTAFYSRAEGGGGFRSLKAKVGSLQRFVRADGVAEDFSPSLFPTLEVTYLYSRMHATDTGPFPTLEVSNTAH